MRIAGAVQGNIRGEWLFQCATEALDFSECLDPSRTRRGGIDVFLSATVLDSTGEGNDL